MTLRVIKGKGVNENGSGNSDRGVFIIETRKIEDKGRNIKGEVGYIAEVNGKISVSFKLIPQVVRYTSYKEANRQINHIRDHIGNGVELNILGQKRIEELLAGQTDLDVVVPVDEVKDTYIVKVFDINTNETIGYLEYNPDTKKYSVKSTKEAVAFWEGKENVDNFIEGAKPLIANHPNLELKSELNK